MKILLNTPDLTLPGGVAEYLKTLALDQEPNIDYFCIHDYAEKNVAVRMLKKYWDFFKLLKKYDLVHLHPSLGFKSFIREAGFIILAQILGKKILVTFHGWEDQFEEKLKNNFLLLWLFKKTYTKVDGYMVLGEIFKKKLKNLGVLTENFKTGITVVDDSYLDNFNINKRLEKKNKFSILFLSRIETEKGIYIAIDAFRKLKTNFNIELIVAGDGPELQKVKEYIALNKIQNINLVGYVRGKEKQKILMNADIFLFPSYYSEGLPIVILEAMLNGLPVISRSVAAIPELVSDGVNGFLSESKNPEDFVPLIERLINNYELYSSIAITNHQKVLNNYTPKHVRSKILAAYEQLKTN